MSVNSIEPTIPIFNDIDGQPLESGYLYFGLSGLDPQINPKAVYWDAGLSALATQPIRTIGGYPIRTGAPGRLYTDGDYSVRLLNKNGSIIYTVLNNSNRMQASQITYIGPDGNSYYLSDLANKTDPARGAGLIGYRDRTIYDKLDDFISVKDFGAVGDGVTDDTTAFTDAINSGFHNIFIPVGNYSIDGRLTLLSNINIFGSGRNSILTFVDGDEPGLYALNKSQIKLSNFSIIYSNAGTTPYIGSVNLFGSSYCEIDSLYVSGASWSGILLNNSNYNKVTNCIIENKLGSLQDSSNICIYRNSNYNFIDKNYCLAASFFGIVVQDPYEGLQPTGNIITNNMVSGSTAYGIVVYVTTPYDTKTIVANNIIRNVTGASLLGLSGSGIYIQSAGGSIVANNVVFNCCISTSNFETNGVGHIAVSIGKYGALAEFPVLVQGNHITAPRGPGIYCTTSSIDININNNTIYSTGTDAVRGEAIFAVNCDYLTIDNNVIKHANTNYQCINVLASDVLVKNVTVTNNKIKGSAYGIAFQKSGTGYINNVICTGNSFNELSSTAFTFLSVTNLTMSNNQAESTGVILSVSGCTRIRLSNNRLKSSYVDGNNIIFTGVGSGNIIDESNDFEGGRFLNDATSGTIISRWGNAAPGGLTWAVGDRVINSVPTPTGYAGWVCTTAGTPGTWKGYGLIEA